jgi:hypothetical protein
MQLHLFAYYDPYYNDPYEPNDDFSSAYGPISFGKEYSCYLSEDYGDYVDYYKFIIPSIGKVKIRLFELADYYKLQLYDINHKLIKESSNEKDIYKDVNMIIFLTSPNTYYFKVTSTPPGHYKFKVDFDTDGEPNDSFATAFPIGFVSDNEFFLYTSTDVDFYKIEIPAYGKIEIELKSSPVDYDLYLYDTNQNLIAFSNDNLIYESIQTEVSRGIWYIKIEGHLGAYTVYEPYFLKVSFTPKPLEIWGNLFNPEKGEKCLIKFSHLGGNVSLRIYDITSDLVKTIYTGDLAWGDYSLEWDGRNDDGNLVSTGIYYLVYNINGYRGKKKIGISRK